MTCFVGLLLIINCHHRDTHPLRGGVSPDRMEKSVEMM